MSSRLSNHLNKSSSALSYIHKSTAMNSDSNSTSFTHLNLNINNQISNYKRPSSSSANTIQQSNIQRPHTAQTERSTRFTIDNYNVNVNSSHISNQIHFWNTKDKMHSIISNKSNASHNPPISRDEFNNMDYQKMQISTNRDYQNEEGNTHE